jgi:tetratricopeptide (TPR) repeat protein
MEAFREGQVEKSIKLFDQAEAAEPRMDPYLWQRGLSYYYANDFEKASQQFRRDVSANPLDVEEIVWDIASQLRISPSEFPVPQAMSLPPLEKDRRPIMASVYQLYRGNANEEALAKAGHASGKPSDEFYSLLYLGLFAEARQEPSKAENYMRQATHTPYATSVGRSDYMTAVARVHCQLRGWEP